MSKIGYLAVGWLAGAATVMTAALIAEAIEQADTILENGVVLAELEAGDELT